MPLDMEYLVVLRFQYWSSDNPPFSFFLFFFFAVLHWYHKRWFLGCDQRSCNSLNAPFCVLISYIVCMAWIVTHEIFQLSWCNIADSTTLSMNYLITVSNFPSNSPMFRLLYVYCLNSTGFTVASVNSLICFAPKIDLANGNPQISAS